MSDHWGNFFVTANRKIWAYIEEFQRKAHAAGTAQRLSIDEFSKLFREAERSTAGKEKHQKDAAVEKEKPEKKGADIK
ncbi:MAG: hypothetical protein WC976_07185 [Caldisericia bacterium]